MKCQIKSENLKCFSYQDVDLKTNKKKNQQVSLVVPILLEGTLYPYYIFHVTKRVLGALHVSVGHWVPGGDESVICSQDRL